MDSRLLLAWLHLLALGVGLAGVWARARALRDSLHDPADTAALRRAFVGDTWWGVAGALWLVTGLWRLFGSTEKSTGYYLANHAFYLKMALFAAVVALEIWPMMTLMRWRTGRAQPDARDAGRIEVISYVQCALVVAMVLAATSMARGHGMRAGPPATPQPAPAATAPVSQRSDSAEVTPMTPSGTETITADDLALLSRQIAMPVPGVSAASLRSGFNERRGGGTRQHRAIDIMAPRRTVVRSATRGRVLKLFTSAAGGLMVYAADSTERWVLMYAHLDGYAGAMRDGAPLERGQVIGFVGSTGNASPDAPHLHFAIARSADVQRWSRGQPIDPVPVLQASVNP